MKVATFLLLVTLFTVSSALDLPIIGPNATNSLTGEAFQAFMSWQATFDKAYKSTEEKDGRFQVFKDNLRFIEEHNSGKHTYMLGLNKFADLTNEEFRTIYTSNMSMNSTSTVTSDRYAFRPGDVLPDFVDWREAGAVTPVKDQGRCASGWAFSVTGAVEGINKIVTGNLVPVSEQELVNCDTSYNQGCKGGLMDHAFEFIIKNRGIHTEEDYPYTGTDGICDANNTNTKVVTIDSYEYVPNDELSLQKAVANQPVSVAVRAGCLEFQLYKSGIFSGSCGSDSGHAVQLIGFGTERGKPYWLVKNSWGRDWGMDGYMKIGRLDITTHTIEDVVKPKWGTVMDFVMVARSIVE
ncbi:putative actinidain [Helianthus debilis subsp. tardiflorus]